ncbi:hypothetical protein ACFQ0I_03080 [Mariniflexile aquimaris]|uniref:Oligosaccharide repeat unit polymerase n=1 Tax=Mariniflexile aquimaris TaxID=881009 RepID=A0ABW3BNT1_9FLAO
MVLNIKKSVLAFYLVALFGVIVSAIGFYILPERFFYDTVNIINDPYNEIGLKGSFPFTIWFYNVTGLKYWHFSLIGVLQYLIIVTLLYKIGVPDTFNKLTIKNILVYLAFIMTAIFISMPSKEFITFLYMALIIFIIKKREQFSKKTVVYILGLLLFFGYFFRQYYILVAVISVVFYAVSRVNFKNKRLVTFFYGLFIAIIMSLSYGIIKGTFLSYETREFINEFRAGRDATNSAIISPIPTDTWYGESFGIVYGFISVNLPVNGLKHIMSPQIIVFVFWQLLLFIILFIRYDKCLAKGIKNNYDLWIFYILFSFFISQGIFEPDLGSAIRHKMGVFPLIYFALYYDSFRKKI